MNEWRAWHRWAGTIGGLFILFIALTGIWLQIDETIGIIQSRASKASAPPPVMAPIEPAAHAARAQQIAAASHPGKAIVSLAIDAKDGKPTAVLRLEGQADPVVIDLATGQEQPAAKPAEPGLKKRLRQWAFSLHAITFAGPLGHIFGALVGFTLVFLIGSGLWMWTKLGRERAKRKLDRWLWR